MLRPDAKRRVTESAACSADRPSGWRVPCTCAVLVADLEVAVRLQVALRSPLFQDDLPRSAEDLIIDDHHDRQRDIETA